MTERSSVILELARNELLHSGQEAAGYAVLSVGLPLIRAGRALDAVLSAYREAPHDDAALRRLAHQAMAAMEEAFGKLQRLRHAEAYQVLLDLAYR